MRIPSALRMAKQLTITLSLIGLMAGSLCAESVNDETLNRQNQENVHASTRRLLLPRLSNYIYHPDPPVSASPKQNYVPAAPAAAKEYNNAEPVPQKLYDSEPAPPAPKEYFDAQPALPRSKEFYSTPAPRLNRGAYKIVDCGDRLCAGIWIGRRIFVLNEV